MQIVVSRVTPCGTDMDDGCMTHGNHIAKVRVMFPRRNLFEEKAVK